VRLKKERTFDLDLVLVRDVMSTNVVSVPPDITLTEFEKMIERYKYTGYPVVENGKLIGMVTIRELQKISRGKRSKMKVRDITLKNVVVTYPNESARIALDKMYVHGIGKLPVVEDDRNRKVIGIITEKDIIRAIELAAEKTTEM